MSEVELATQALVAGVTVGLTETVQRGARDAWDRLISLVRRDRGDGDGEEQPAADRHEGTQPVDEPDRGAHLGGYTVTVNGGKGVLVGSHGVQHNQFR